MTIPKQRSWWLHGLFVVAWLAVDGCGAGSLGVDYGRWDGSARMAAGSALRVRWSKLLVAEYGGAFVPVERAGAALDPVHGRVYVGSTRAKLLAFEPDGRLLYEYVADSGIEVEPTLD